MKNALNKDILRTIWKGKKRFVSIMLITTLGVTVMTGLAAGCLDLRVSADRFFDAQELFDVCVQSTLGLTDEDVEALLQLEGVEQAEGSFSEIVHTKKGALNKTAEVKVIKTEGLNLPYIVEGELPGEAGEIAVTKNYIAETGKQIGDIVEIEELLDEEETEDTVVNEEKPDINTEEGSGNDKKEENDISETDLEIEIKEEEETPTFPNTTFKITGVVVDAMDINNAEGSAGFRATPNADYTFFVTPQDVDSEIYTAIYMKLSGTEELLCYSDEYEAKTTALISIIEKQIMEQREKARYEEIMEEAYEKINEAEEEMNEKFAEAEQEFADAEEEINDGWKEIKDGRQELIDKEKEVAQEIADARKELEDGYSKLEDGRKELQEASYKLSDGERQLNDGRQELIKQEENMNIQLQKAKDQLDSNVEANTTQKQTLEAGLAQIIPVFGEEWSKENGLQTDWDNYVNAATDVLLPIMMQQAANGGADLSGAGMNPEDGGGMAGADISGNDAQMNQLLAVLEQDADYVAARDVFMGKSSTVIENMSAAIQLQMTEMTNQVSALEGQISSVQSDISILESEKTVLQTDIAVWESEKIKAEEDRAALDEGDAGQNNIPSENETENAGQNSGVQTVSDINIEIDTQNIEDIEKQKAELDRKIEELAGNINVAKEQLVEMETQIASKNTELQTVIASKATIEATMEAMLPVLNEQAQSLSQVPASLVKVALGLAQTNATAVVLENGYNEYYAQKQYAKEQIADAWKQIEAGEQEIAQGKAQLAEAQKEIEENRQKLDDGVIELNENEQKAQKEFADARQELADGELELLDGEAELAENRVEYEEKKADALVKIEDAKKEIEDIDMTKWYVQDRTSLSGYSNVESDAASIESLASVFCIVFFVVAILISLTTVTRMVEEERGLIGTYKALGFTDSEIRRKYVAYALAASVFGGILGDIGGFIILPEILFIFFDVMYMLPEYFLQFDFSSGSVSVILFIIGITGAAIAACFAELKHLPAHLMRPKSPKMGSRVFLEYLTPVWKRMSFLNKVTARNLFRYKKRFFMTVFGIMGCTALLVFGFAIKDTVSELMPLQYEKVYKYDLLAACSADDNNKLIQYMEHHDEVEKYLNIQVESVKLKNVDGNSEKVQMMVFEDTTEIAEYFTLTNREYKQVTLPEEGIFLTENAAKILGLDVGTTVAIQKLDLVQKEMVIADIVKNYLGNNVYVSRTAYEKMFEEYKPNGILAKLSDSCTNQIAFADKLSEEDWILSSVSTEDLKEGFSAAFTLINIVVYVILILAAGLAFVVLFTLASVNISERIRELATIKVLGFFDREVHSYVNKETLILTVIGILLGLPVGRVISGALTEILSMPSIYFAVTIYEKSYFYAAGLSLLFAILVQFMTDRTLNVIEPAEALKSVE